jgi:hypothetical protein
MSKVQKPKIGSAGLIAVTALSVAALTSTSAQQPRSNYLNAAADPVGAPAAIGQPEAPPVLNPRHPDTYVVQPGDTLWDIAAMFLRDPWYWPEIWQINPQVVNPHLIYPGDLLSLAYLDDGRPAVTREFGPGGTVRLSPRIRSEPLEEAIPTIPLEVLRAFLSRPRVISAAEIETLPYVVAHHEGLLGAAGNDLYVRGTSAEVGSTLSVVHLGDPLIDPDDGTVLGYAGIYVGQGALRAVGDPSTLRLTDSAREALVGDFLFESDEPLPATFLPRAPDSDIEGRIITVIDGLSLIGQYQVVVVNRGSRHGLEPGHVLRGFHAGQEIVDPVRGGSRLRGEKVRLPDEPAGLMMVFRSYDRMSYALVMEATREMRVLDPVRNP